MKENKMCYDRQRKLCDDQDCEICFNRSLASFEGKTKKGKKKIDCWDYERNDLTPRDIFLRPRSKAWFKCDNCPHSFYSPISWITNDEKSTWCPYCPKISKVFCDDVNCEFCLNTSFDTYEGKTVNGKLKKDCLMNQDPKRIKKTSAKKLSFLCDVCNHEFCSTLGNIVGCTSWCPYCSSKILCKSKKCKFCFNKSFASCKLRNFNKDLCVEQWDHSKNKLTPREIFLNSSRKMWFYCNVCEESFQMVVASINHRDGWWCMCRNKSEKKFKKWFVGNFEEEITHQKRFKWCRNPESGKILPFDFYIKDLKLIIEVDGRFHFDKEYNRGDLDEVVKRDNLKMKLALEKGYSVIRIFKKTCGMILIAGRKRQENILDFMKNLR